MSTEDEHAQDDDRTREQPHVGSLGEEAMRLFSSVAGWAGQHGTEAHHGVGDAARQAYEGVQAMAHGMEEHLATGAAECTWCPICRTVHAVRELSPEVKAHLVSAASSLVKASSALLATVVPDHGPATGGSSAEPGTRNVREERPRVQRIDIDDSDPTT